VKDDNAIIYSTRSLLPLFSDQGGLSLLNSQFGAHVNLRDDRHGDRALDEIAHWASVWHVGIQLTNCT